MSGLSYPLAGKGETEPIRVLRGAKTNTVVGQQLWARSWQQEVTPAHPEESRAYTRGPGLYHRGFPTGSKVVKKIEKGEFIGFTDLLPKKLGGEEQSYIELAKEGIIVVTELRHLRSQKKYIQDVSTLAEAFLTYSD